MASTTTRQSLLTPILFLLLSSTSPGVLYLQVPATLFHSSRFGLILKAPHMLKTIRHDFPLTPSTSSPHYPLEFLLSGMTESQRHGLYDTVGADMDAYDRCSVFGVFSLLGAMMRVWVFYSEARRGWGVLVFVLETCRAWWCWVSGFLRRKRICFFVGAWVAWKGISCLAAPENIFVEFLRRVLGIR